MERRLFEFPESRLRRETKLIQNYLHKRDQEIKRSVFHPRKTLIRLECLSSFLTGSAFVQNGRKGRTCKVPDTRNGSSISFISIVINIDQGTFGRKTQGLLTTDHVQ